MTTTTTTMTTAEEGKKEGNKIVVFLTGFGPFGGVDENPTTILIRELPTFLEEQDQTQRNNDDDDNTTTASKQSSWKAQVKDRIREMIIVETSAEGATRAMEELTRKIEAMMQGTEPNIKVFCLHLGVNVFGTGFHLEQCAYNDASFRIPDQRGYQPKDVPVLSDAPLGSPCHTHCNVADLVEHLSQAFPAIESKASTDPGRFVCNYLYYTSLNKIQKEIPKSIEGTLFLHLPPFERIPKEIQLEYLAELMRVVTRIDLH